MPIYKLGYLIKRRREEIGYTQEDLADGICSVPTLSRIENGERLPTKDHFEMLLQRLGLSDAFLYSYVDENTLLLHELKFQIRQAIILNQFQIAHELLEEYKKNVGKGTPIEQQFIILNETIADSESYEVEERLKRFESAICLTCPQYREGKFPGVLFYEEIIILNNIAGCYLSMQKIEKAIKILYQIKRYYENKVLNREEILRTQPMILYNLSKCLGLAQQYDECVEICNLGIKIARETGRCNFLAMTLYNRAWALSKRKRIGDMAQAEESANLALFMATVMEDWNAIEHYRRFIRETFS